MQAKSSVPSVAVIVPVFNRLTLLRLTVASLRAQTLEDAEFILVDDHSDEETWAYLQKVMLEDSRFTVLRKPLGLAKGCQSSRNFGLEQCRAQNVVFLDSDDLLAPDCLELRYGEMCALPEFDILVGRQAMFWDSTGEIKWVNVPDAGQSDLERCLDLHDPLDVPWVNGGVMIRTDRLREKAIRWSTAYHWDDLAFHFSCLVSGMTVTWTLYGDLIPDSYYRKHEGEHYGQTLHTAEGIRNSAEMMLWMKQMLEKEERWTAGRRLRLARSFFHLCALKLIDLGDHRMAWQLVSGARAVRLFNGVEVFTLRCFLAGRKLFQDLPRATYCWNRLARKTYLKKFFPNSVWTYGTISPLSPSSQESLKGLTALCSRISPSWP